MNPELSIIYRDQWLIAIDKPTGMLVHPGDDPNTVAPIAMKVLRDQIGAKIWTIHRLDCPTSGVLLYALSDQLQPHMQQQFEIGEVEKTYLAVCVGETPECWLSDQPLQKSESEPARAAETQFVRKSLVSIGDHLCSLLSIKPITGRYHQIRKHLALAGHPILGDYRYGKEEINESINDLVCDSRLMLHARQLVFTHPVSSEQLIINAPVPSLFAKITDRNG